jgi:hypothetical protein
VNVRLVDHTRPIIARRVLPERCRQIKAKQTIVYETGLPTDESPIVEGDGPAAPSAASARDKTIIESRADTRSGEPPGESKTGPQPDLRA